MSPSFIRHLTFLIIIALVPAILAAFVFYQIQEKGALESKLNFHETLAEELAGYVDDYTRVTTENLKMLSLHGTIMTALKEEVVCEKELAEEKGKETIDENWIFGNDTCADKLLENVASKILKEVKNAHSLFDEILAANDNGLLVAASNRTTDYVQDDECWWQAPMGRTRNDFCENIIANDDYHAAVIMNVTKDASSDTYGFDIAYAVIGEGDGAAPRGVIKATMTYAALNVAIRSRIGSQFALLNSQGEWILGSGSSNPPSHQKPLDEAVLDLVRGNFTRRVTKITEPIEIAGEVFNAIGAIARTDTGWFLVTYEIKDQALNDTIWKTWLLFTLIALISISMACLTFALMTRRILMKKPGVNA